MSAFINEKGNRYGKLIVLEQSGKIGTSVAWLCKCDCGNETIVRGTYLRNGKTTSCGCNRGGNNALDLSGKKFNLLTAINKAYSKNNLVFWNCLCECGNTTIVRARDLKSGKVKSCGCLRSIGESTLKKIFDLNNILYEKEFILPDLKKENNLRFDFMIRNNKNEMFFIEYNGIQHYSYIREEGHGLGSKKCYLTSVESDLLKQQYCSANNYHLYIIRYDENIEEKALSILQSEGILNGKK